MKIKNELGKNQLFLPLMKHHILKFLALYILYYCRVWGLYIIVGDWEAFPSFLFGKTHVNSMKDLNLKFDTLSISIYLSFWTT